MNETSRWLPRLDPPPGGPEQLRARLHERTRQRPTFAQISAAALGVLILVAGGLLLRPTHQTDKQPALSTNTTHNTAHENSDNSIVVHNGAALELPSHNPKVRIYLVVTRPAPGGSNRREQPPI